jgi:hypothetical protein
MKDMPPHEEILGAIEYVKGGLPSWIGYHNIILTNKRVLVTSIQRFTADRDLKSLLTTNWRDLFNPVKEVTDTELNLMMSLDEILAKDKSTYSVYYNEITSINFSKDMWENHVSFTAHGKRFSFSFPVTQKLSVDRWKRIYNRMTQMNTCPKCRGRLRMTAGDVGLCTNCNMNYKMNVRDFRYEFHKERRERTDFRNKATGVLLIVSGSIYLIATLYALYFISETTGLYLSDELSSDYGISIPFAMLIPCSFIFPLFFIITGVLVYVGSGSGKVMFGVICILFGLAMILAGYLAGEGGEEGGWAFNILFSGIGFAIAGYGVILIRNTLKRPRYI